MPPSAYSLGPIRVPRRGMAYLAVLVELHSTTVSQATAFYLGLALCGLTALLAPILWALWCEWCDQHICETHASIVIEIDRSQEPTRMATTPFWRKSLHPHQPHEEELAEVEVDALDTMSGPTLGCIIQCSHTIVPTNAYCMQRERRQMKTT